MGVLILSFHQWESVFGAIYLYPISVASAMLLDFIGVPTVLDASRLAEGFCALATQKQLFHVKFECTGIFSLFVYVGVVAVYPTAVAHKAWGILAGIPAFFAYSAGRIVVLGVIGHLMPSWLRYSHIYLMVLLNLGFFLFLWAIWVNRSPGQVRGQGG